MSSGGSSYRLTGDTRELQRYVGQQVEIRGKLQGSKGSSSYSGSEPSSSSPSGSSSTGTSTGETTGTSSTGTPQTGSATGSPAGSSSGQSQVGGQSSSAYGSGMEMPLVHVSSVRSLGTSCSGSQK